MQLPTQVFDLRRDPAHQPPPLLRPPRRPRARRAERRPAHRAGLPLPQRAPHAREVALARHHRLPHLLQAPRSRPVPHSAPGAGRRAARRGLAARVGDHPREPRHRHAARRATCDTRGVDVVAMSTRNSARRVDDVPACRPPRVSGASSSALSSTARVRLSSPSRPTPTLERRSSRSSRSSATCSAPTSSATRSSSQTRSCTAYARRPRRIDRTDTPRGSPPSASGCVEGDLDDRSLAAAVAHVGADQAHGLAGGHLGRRADDDASSLKRRRSRWRGASG
jgi:hypothetical protein